jgi:uncharacterized membrane protein
VLVSVVVFLGYIHHVAQSIRVATIIAATGAGTRSLLERRRPADTTTPGPPDFGPGPVRVVATPCPGTIQSVDDGALHRHRGGSSMRRSPARSKVNATG